FVAAEGQYELLQDISLDQVLPHPVITTHVSSVSVKYKDYLGLGGLGGKSHGKQTSTDSTLSTSNIDHLEEHLIDIKLRDERGTGDDDETVAGRTAGGTLSRNFHGNLIDLPLYNDDGYKGAMNGPMSPALPQVTTPGPPPLKDSTTSNRVSDPYSQYGPPPPLSLQNTGIKALSRANSQYSSGQDDSANGSFHSSSAPGPATGFSSFFGGKKKKPKNNIAKTNSTFVSKITTHENLAKILANRIGEDVYLFWNTGRTFAWSDMGQKPNEPLSQIAFSKAFPTSHDVNVLTRSCDSLDVIIGFSTGDIIWFDPLCNKYYRLNKQAIIKDSAVTMIKWLPGSESQFMVAFHDGSMLIMDKERDDNAFTVPTHSDDSMFHVTRPKNNKYNPISHWQVTKKPITAFAFSPDLQHVAVVSMDGYLRVIDFRNERLLDTFSAYFGALNCVCWSPDGKYILTGGQDDLVTIWSFKDQRIIARCQGHQSYVTGVAFDPWRCDERNYRFGSVGEDTKLLLWDFSVSSLPKPKAATSQRRGSNATLLAGTNGTGAYKPGHKSKGSISSLRGNGGQSLFSGHNNNSSPATKASLTSSSLSMQQHQHHYNPQSTPAIAEEPANDGASPDISSTTSSTRNSGVHDTHISASNTTQSQLHPHAQGEGSSIKSIASTDSSVYSANLVSETPRGRAYSTSTTTNATIAGFGTGDSPDAGSSAPIYKKSSHNRTLPNLHINKSNHYHESNGDGKGDNGISSMFRNSNGTLSNHSVQIVKPPEPRSHVAMLQPLVAKDVHQEPLASITFREDAILTSDRRGHIKIWKRPPSYSSHQ
ncbi:hypothetical protein BGZ76_006398, partial [Entomortierella beljakovae]